ncbi:MAG: VWA domain-containing protein, partial [Acidobacteria bacterium]
QADSQRPVFKSGVDLVHVTATVTDNRGHFVRGLQREDFRVTEDGQPQTILQFSADRAPVSLGIALDTSSSMAGAKIREAKEALRRVIEELLERDDEVFLYTFSDTPVLRQSWTTDREALRRALEAAPPDGRTALYDTVDEALALMESGKYRKKVLLVVSDGNDTASFTPVTKLRARISESETLVYAIGIDSNEQRLKDGLWRIPRTGPRRQIRRPQPPGFPPRPPIGKPPGPGGGRPPWASPPQPTPQAPRGLSDTANIQALRELTDISGGRTEVVRSSSDLGPATASVADELSMQYQLMYQATTRRDGRWHAIEVTVREGHQVRARRGYLATP